jgi:hypothetical protein
MRTMSWRLQSLWFMLASLSRAASLSGAVGDPAEMRVPGATVTLTIRGGTLDPLKATTDAGGRFTFEGIAPGTYDLLVQMPGFVSRKQIDIHIDSGDVELPELVLIVGVGCGGYGPPPTWTQRILLKIKRFFAPIDWSKVTICE